MPDSRTESALGTAEEQKVVEQLREGVRTKRLPRGLDPAKLVKETRSARIRDAAALALLDLGHPKAAELLIDLIANHDTQGHRGTLLYVLNELEASVPLDTLVEILVTGPYDAREEGLTLLQYARADDAERSRALAKLVVLKRSSDEELSVVASEAIDLLSQR